jgi:uncharacterized protein
MPSLTLDNNQAKYQIKSYQPGEIKINDTLLHNSVIITPEHIIPDWQPQSIADLTAECLKPLIELKPDIVLIGTGGKMEILKAEIYGELVNLEIGIEFMDTSAACRTYNALTSENRNVAAALLIK